MKIITFEKKRMIPLTNKQRGCIRKQKSSSFAKQKSVHKCLNDKTIAKVGTIAVILVNTEVFHIVHVI